MLPSATVRHSRNHPHGYTLSSIHLSRRPPSNAAPPPSCPRPGNRHVLHAHNIQVAASASPCHHPQHPAAHTAIIVFPLSQHIRAFFSYLPRSQSRREPPSPDHSPPPRLQAAPQATWFPPSAARHSLGVWGSLRLRGAGNGHLEDDAVSASGNSTDTIGGLKDDLPGPMIGELQGFESVEAMYAHGEGNQVRASPRQMIHESTPSSCVWQCVCSRHQHLTGAYPALQKGAMHTIGGASASFLTASALAAACCITRRCFGASCRKSDTATPVATGGSGATGTASSGEVDLGACLPCANNAHLQPDNCPVGVKGVPLRHLRAPRGDRGIQRCLWSERAYFGLLLHHDRQEEVGW